MSKLSFRARALDPSKPMPIYLAEELPDLPEYSAINRAVPQMPSGMEKEEESVSKSPSKVTAHFALIRAATEKNEVLCAAILPKADKSRMALDRPIGVEFFGFYGEFGIEPSVRMKEHHLQRAICTGLIIPTPEVFEATDSEFYEKYYPTDYKMPKQMIHMQPALNLEQDVPDYDMDSADEQWVNTQNKRLDLDPLKFETMMDRLEKSSGQTVVTLNEAKALLKQDDELSIAVYDYWLNKRLKTQHPLILSVKTETRGNTTPNNPYLAFRRRTEKMQTRKNRKNDESSYEKMLKLRRDLSRAVTLLEMIKRREKIKREQLHLGIEIYEKRYQTQDFNGQLLSEFTANATKASRPAFAPIYSNQYSSHHSTLSGSAGAGTSGSGPYHGPSSSSSHYHHHVGGTSSSKRDSESLSSSRKEKRQYKKRKHKIQKERSSGSSATVTGSSAAGLGSAGVGTGGVGGYHHYQYHPAGTGVGGLGGIAAASGASARGDAAVGAGLSSGTVDPALSSDEEELANLQGTTAPEEEYAYAFRRSKLSQYHRPITKGFGDWPWVSKEENGKADLRYRFALTSLRHPRPAFAPIYSNQYSSHHSTLSGSAGAGTSGSGPYHGPSSSSSHYHHHVGGTSSSKRDSESLSSSRKEKRQYKKRKHKIQKERSSGSSATVTGSSAAGLGSAGVGTGGVGGYHHYQYHPAGTGVGGLGGIAAASGASARGDAAVGAGLSSGTVDPALSSDEEELANLQGTTAPEEEYAYAFRRSKLSQYHRPITKGFGDWPWVSKEENGKADLRYRFALTSLRHPRPRCIGFARRRIGRGGRVIIDRASTDLDDLWSRLDYKIIESETTPAAAVAMEPEEESIVIPVPSSAGCAALTAPTATATSTSATVISQMERKWNELESALAANSGGVKRTRQLVIKEETDMDDLFMANFGLARRIKTDGLSEEVEVKQEKCSDERTSAVAAGGTSSSTSFFAVRNPPSEEIFKKLSDSDGHAPLDGEKAEGVEAVPTADPEVKVEEDSDPISATIPADQIKIEPPDELLAACSPSASSQSAPHLQTNTSVPAVGSTYQQHSLSAPQIKLEPLNYLQAVSHTTATASPAAASTSFLITSPSVQVVQPSQATSTVLNPLAAVSSQTTIPVVTAHQHQQQHPLSGQITLTGNTGSASSSGTSTPTSSYIVQHTTPIVLSQQQMQQIATSGGGNIVTVSGNQMAITKQALQQQGQQQQQHIQLQHATHTHQGETYVLTTATPTGQSPLKKQINGPNDKTVKQNVINPKLHTLINQKLAASGQKAGDLSKKQFEMITKALVSQKMIVKSATPANHGTTAATAAAAAQVVQQQQLQQQQQQQQGTSGTTYSTIQNAAGLPITILSATSQNPQQATQNKIILTSSPQLIHQAAGQLMAAAAAASPHGKISINSNLLQQQQQGQQIAQFQTTTDGGQVQATSGTAGGQQQQNVKFEKAVNMLFDADKNRIVYANIKNSRGQFLAQLNPKLMTVVEVDVAVAVGAVNAAGPALDGTGMTMLSSSGSMATAAAGVVSDSMIL
ncbi:hypothetical protein RP20_CCG019745 [Aedes albopictus]|nr:hypothetical protein RP20_CCG019745 [Aedes albopictus]